MPLRVIQVVVSIVCFFLLLSSIQCMGVPQFVLTVLLLRQFERFPVFCYYRLLLDIINRFVWTEDFIYWGWMPRSAANGLYGKCMFRLLRKWQHVAGLSFYSALPGGWYKSRLSSLASVATRSGTGKGTSLLLGKWAFWLPPGLLLMPPPCLGGGGCPLPASTWLPLIHGGGDGVLIASERWRKSRLSAWSSDSTLTVGLRGHLITAGTNGSWSSPLCPCWQ